MKFCFNYAFDYSNEYLIQPEILDFIIKKLFTDEKYKDLIEEVKLKIETNKPKKTYSITNYLKSINRFVK